MKTIRCPQCRAVTTFDSSNKYRPFCSERCSILDLGAWADETYAVPAEESETPAVNKNPDDTDLDDDHSFNPPPKHQLN